MNRSEQINELAAALSVAQGQLEHARKDANNPFFNSRYADLAACWDALKKPLSDNSLSVIQLARVDETRVYVLTMLMHASGQWINEELSAAPKNLEPQTVGSVITYLRRYGLSAITGLASEDDDGNAGQGRTEQPTQRGKANSKAKDTKKELSLSPYSEKLQEALNLPVDTKEEREKVLETIYGIFREVGTLVSSEAVSKARATEWKGNLFVFWTQAVGQADENRTGNLVLVANDLLTGDESKGRKSLLTNQQHSNAMARAEARMDTLSKGSPAETAA